MQSTEHLDAVIGDAIVGIDTLWGGDVQSASGTGRVIADCWFSDLPLPRAYTDATADKVRQSGGVSAVEPNVAALDAYLASIDVRGAIDELAVQASRLGGLRGAYLEGLAQCLEVMWDLALEILGKNEPVPYERCVEAATGAPPEPSDPESQRQRLADLLAGAGYPAKDAKGLLAAVDAWRQAQRVPKAQIPDQGARLVAEYDALAVDNLLPFLPRELAATPRANVTLLPIENAWFSGSMNYLGKARQADGSPQYEATYEINAALNISMPEFRQLVSHEVVPGHVTTFAYLQNAFVRRIVNFEATVQAMNTRASALCEGIANNAILIAHGVNEVAELADTDLEIGVTLALLQDDAKNQASYLTWKEGREQEEVAAVLRQDFLVSEERADKLSGAWGRHPLLGRMLLPVYRAGTRRVARLRRAYPPAKVLPVLYGCRGLVDLVTAETLLEGSLTD